MGKPRVALLRGRNLNKWDMQCYEPLAGKVNFQAIAPPDNRFDLSMLRLPLLRLNRARSFSRALLRLPQWLARKWRNGLKGRDFFWGDLAQTLADYDIFHSAELTSRYTASAAYFKRRFGKRLIVNVWENIPFRYLMQTPREQWIREQVVPEVDIFLALTEQARTALLLEGIAEERIRVVYPGLDLAVFAPGPWDSDLGARLSIDPDDLVIAFCGRLEKEKGVYSLVHAAALLIRDPAFAANKIKFMILGQGPEGEGMVQLVARYGLEDYFSFIPYVPYMEIPFYFRLADIFVLPSIPQDGWQEQFGMVLAENMALERAVVGSRSGAIAEVVGDAGLLVSPGQYEDLYLTLKRLLLDPDLRKSLGHQAGIRARALFDAQTNAKKIYEIYASLS